MPLDFSEEDYFTYLNQGGIFSERLHFLIHTWQTSDFVLSDKSLKVVLDLFLSVETSEGDIEEALVATIPMKEFFKKGYPMRGSLKNAVMDLGLILKEMLVAFLMDEIKGLPPMALTAKLVLGDKSHFGRYDEYWNEVEVHLI